MDHRNDDYNRNTDNRNKENEGDRSLYSTDFMMSPQEVRKYAQGNKRKAVVLTPEAKLMLNCSHRAENGQAIVKPEILKMQDMSGETKNVQVLKCQFCGAVISPITELEHKKISGELMSTVTKISDYIKVFDPRFSESVREILVTWGYETLLVKNILDETMRANKKDKSRNNDNRNNRRVNSSDIFRR